MYAYNEIKTLHLEITERCNANCPQCGRNINGGEENPFIANRELSIDNIKQIVPTTLVQQLQHIYMCGNYGDPIVAKDTLQAYEYFRENNSKLLLNMNTNGSARTKDWWQELAKIYNGSGYVIFSIDGLEDTNHIYRRNTVWNKIIDNVTAFINAGGIAHWEYIVFKHNEHQIEQAELLSKELGFSKFQIKKTARFASNFIASVKEGTSFTDKKGNKIEVCMPDNPKYRNPVLKNISNLAGSAPVLTLPTTYDEVKDKLNQELFTNPLMPIYDKTEIDCKVKKEKSIYVSAEGIVQPCCWIASNMYPWYYLNKRSQVWKLINKVGIDNLNALKHSIEEIVSSEYFTKLIVDSWQKPTCREGKLTVCAKTCGKDLETFSKQYA